MSNISFEYEQEQRERDGIAAVEAQIERETDLYYQGESHGLDGLEPTQVDDYIYWQGYQLGLRQYWGRKRKAQIPAAS